MSSFVGVLVSDQWLQSEFTQVELRGLKSKVNILYAFAFFFLFLINYLIWESDDMIMDLYY